jgi:cell filamentation protein
MSYELKEDPYLDGSSGVLKNLLEITTSEELARVEGNITGIQITSLAERPVEGGFNLDHLQAIHRRIFGSIYPWAGELRTVELTAGSTKFASLEYLPQAAQEVFSRLRDVNLLVDLSDEEYPTQLAHYYSEVNVLHPFREGNGRTQRAFFSLVAAQSGRFLAWDHLDPQENIQASIAAYSGNESELARMLAELVVQKQDLDSAA